MSNCIFLMGVRGCGKSTLGLMASVLFNFPYIDLEQCVSYYTGMSDSIYLQSHTIDEYQKLQFDLIVKSISDIRQNSASAANSASVRAHPEVNTSAENDSGSGSASSASRGTFYIFVLPAVCIENPLIVDYFTKQNFPYIINIEREEIKILDYLEYEDSYDVGTKIVRSKFAKFRSVSTHSYFNLHSDSSNIEYIMITERKNRSAYDTISLKQAENDFVHFLTGILDRLRIGLINLSDHLLHYGEKFSSAVQIEYPSLHLQDLIYNFSNVVAGCDTIEVNLDLAELIKLGLEDMETYLNRFVATVRRYSFYLRIILKVKQNLGELDSFLIDYSSTTGMDYDSQQDLAAFYINFLSIAKRMAIAFVVLDLELLLPFGPKTMESDQASLNSANDTSAVHTPNRDLQPSSPSNNRSISTTPANPTTSNMTNIIINDNNLNEIKVLVSDFIAKMGNTTKVIGQYHAQHDENFWDSNNGALKIVEFASEMKINFLRLTCQANSLTDNLKCWNFMRYVETEYPNMLVSAFNTGVMGRMSKLLNRLLTPVHTDFSRSFSSDETEESDKLSNFEIQKSLHTAFVIPTYHYYYLGLRMRDNLSPVILNATFRKLGLPHKCAAYECTSLSSVSNLFKTSNFGGAFITEPFTEEAMTYADTLSEHARLIGSVTNLVAERSLKNPTKILRYRGLNTTWHGITIMIKGSLSAVNYAAKTRSALILGAGSVSRASIYACILLGYENIMVFHPNYAEAMKAVNHFNNQCPLVTENRRHYFRVCAISEHDVLTGTLPESCQYPNVIISADPIIDPKTGNSIEVDLPIIWFSSETGGVVVETKFDPIDTPLVRTCSDLLGQGWVACIGLNTFLGRTAIEFEYFLKKPAPRPFLKTTLLEHYKVIRPEVDLDIY